MATATFNVIISLLLAAAAKAVVTENVAFTSNQMLGDEVCSEEFHLFSMEDLTLHPKI